MPSIDITWGINVTVTDSSVPNAQSATALFLLPVVAPVTAVITSLSDGEVLVPMPTYPLYTAILAKLGARARYYRTDPAKGWQPDPEEVRRLITPRTKAIVVNDPNNPTGTLVDATLPLLESVAAGVPSVEHVTSAKARWTGHALNAELQIMVDASLSVQMMATDGPMARSSTIVNGAGSAPAATSS